MVSYALTIYLPSFHQVSCFLTRIICTCIPNLLAKILAHFIGSYLVCERGRKWIYGIGYQVGTMVTQFVIHPYRSHMGFPMDGRLWLLGHIIPLAVRGTLCGCQLWLIMWGQFLLPVLWTLCTNYTSYRGRFPHVVQGLLTLPLMRQGGNWPIWVRIVGSSQSSMTFMTNSRFFGRHCSND